MPTFPLITPRFTPPLEPDFRPAALANRAYLDGVWSSRRAVPLVVCLERGSGAISRYDTLVYDEAHPLAETNLFYAERLVKFLLWARGGWRITIGGPRSVADHIRRVYSPEGERAFDHRFMGAQVFERPFEVVHCRPEDAPAARESGEALGGHSAGARTRGARIGFDLGASDLKVSAVLDGVAVFSEEIVWEPVGQSDPAYHYERIRAALALAAARLPRVDAIGGSSAGVFVDNRPMVASLFRGIPAERYSEIRSLFGRLSAEFGAPLVVVNDGDVTALAGALSLGDNGVLGIALGSSEAAGYVDGRGAITGWLNELAFAPVDYNPGGPVDEWSGDRGVGSQYFSQQCVFRLAPVAGIEIPPGLTAAERLRRVQEALEAGHAGARAIWESIGVYLGYGLAHYADFYADLRHALILGRVTSGRGGEIILEGARHVLAGEFPELAEKIDITLPDEKFRRLGQSVVAASLPDTR
jgi:predicted NBD/HSP70 family sugar kinase